MHQTAKPTEFTGLTPTKEDPIFGDKFRLERAASLFANHKDALVDILTVLIRQRAYKMVHLCSPEDLLALREGIDALESVYDKAGDYFQEFTDGQKKVEQNKSETNSSL